MFGILFVSQRLYDAAKDAEESYEEDLTLTLRRVQFFNVKGTEAEEDGALIYAPTFGQNISLNSSGVHIPLEIFEGCKYSESICVVEISVQAVVLSQPTGNIFGNILSAHADIPFSFMAYCGILLLSFGFKFNTK